MKFNLDESKGQSVRAFHSKQELSMTRSQQCYSVFSLFPLGQTLSCLFLAQRQLLVALAEPNTLKQRHFSPMTYESNRFTRQFREGFRFGMFSLSSSNPTKFYQIWLVGQFASKKDMPSSSIFGKHPRNIISLIRIIEQLLSVYPNSGP